MIDITISVSELNEYVKNKLNSDPKLKYISVKGEISDYKVQAGSGHAYFTIKDERCSINCTMWRSNLSLLRFIPSIGKKVIVTGQVTIYPQNGKYQICVDHMKEFGIGDLYQQFEMLKQRLQNEGLFDQVIKKPLPRKVKTIGVATSLSGAAIRDIIKVARARNPYIDIIIAPCSVQGKGAEYEIAEALRLLDSNPDVEVILVGRGGGSIEDLWPFNEEIVARAIYRCKKPVISCVGHETDFSIADYVADLRASTPSNAAELAVADLQSLIQTQQNLLVRLNRCLIQQQTNRRLHLQSVFRSTVFSRPYSVLIQPRKERLEKLLEQIRLHTETNVRIAHTRLENDKRLLDNSDPRSIQKRGFVCVCKNGHYVTEAAQLSSGDRVTLNFYSDSADAQIQPKGSAE